MDKGCIYTITSLNNNDCYVGSTTNFIGRVKKHKANCLNLSYNMKLYKEIRKNGGFDNYEMNIIENDLPIEYLIYAEQYYIDLLEPNLNTVNAFESKKLKKERKHRIYSKRKEYYKKKMRDRWNEKKDELNELRRKKFKCECGLEVNSSNIKRHKNTKIHKDLINKNNISII